MWGLRQSRGKSILGIGFLLQLAIADGTTSRCLPSTAFIAAPSRPSAPMACVLTQNHRVDQSSERNHGKLVAPLFAKKKKVAPAAAKKIQVKMTKHLAGTGSVGDVVRVTPAFYNNKLRPTSSAVIISDEEVEKEQAEAAAQEKATNDQAEELKAKLESLTLTVKRKAGPDGQLFGGIGAKAVLSELNDQLSNDFFASKSVKILTMTDSEGKKIRGDIRHTGEFGVAITLTKKISASVAIVVEAES